MRGVLVTVVCLTWAATACGSTGSAGDRPRGDCPIPAVAVVVSVDQWGDIAQQLGGDCVSVTTIVEGTSADPHDYEPTPSDIARFDDARLVVVNGVGYDTWAEKALGNLDQRPPTIDAGRIAGKANGANPHVWYDPSAVKAVSAEIAGALSELEPKAASHFEARLAAWQASMRPYDEAIASIRAEAADRRYAATEPVFDDMADALDLVGATPPGYQRAATNGSEPSPGDVAEFEEALRDHAVDVLVVNTQTEGATQDRLRDIAQRARVPVVEVTETVPPGTATFVGWQVGQLRALAEALGA